MVKKTYGQLVQETLENNVQEDDVIEYRKIMEPDIIKNIWSTIHASKDTNTYKNKDFYIVLLFKQERTANNMPRTFTVARLSCPTPVHKQAVWKYHHISAALEFLWSIPDRMLYYHILRNYNTLSMDNETRNLAEYCAAMEDGRLLDWVKKENGEKVDGVIKLNQELTCLTN
jgi:hypothetical protein